MEHKAGVRPMAHLLHERPNDVRFPPQAPTEQTGPADERAGALRRATFAGDSVVPDPHGFPVRRAPRVEGAAVVVVASATLVAVLLQPPVDRIRVDLPQFAA